VVYFSVETTDSLMLVDCMVIRTGEFEVVGKSVVLCSVVAMDISDIVTASLLVLVEVDGKTDVV